MKTSIAFLCLLLTACGAFAADDANPKPKIELALDGFPTGHGTPEGAACDLARAFIKCDSTLFKETCIRIYTGGQSGEEYTKFLEDTAKSIKEEAAKTEPSPEGPKAIGKVFAARYLSKNGPASFGYAAYDFQEIMFVDIGAFLHNGGRFLNRTLVIKDRDGKWYAHPLPGVGSGLLSVGLNDEDNSQKDFSEAYEVQKQ